MSKKETKNITTVRYCLDKCLTGMTAVFSMLIENPDIKEQPMALAIKTRVLCGGHKCNVFSEDYAFMGEPKD